MTNFSSMFIENYSSITAERRKLLHKHSNQKSFENLKKFEGTLYV